jgi:hypothetical protein
LTDSFFFLFTFVSLSSASFLFIFLINVSFSSYKQHDFVLFFFFSHLTSMNIKVSSEGSQKLSLFLPM